MRKRVAALLVLVELDDVPGTMHTVESAKESVQRFLEDRIPHYEPRVYITDDSVAPIVAG